MSNKYVLDTSALFTYIENEKGIDDVNFLLLQAMDEKLELFISIISHIEIFYITLREQGEAKARERLELILDLPIKSEPLDQKTIEAIGKLKAYKSMSLADCCIAGLAKHNKAILVHKDPEFEQVENDIEQLKLPYKIKTN